MANQEHPLERVGAIFFETPPVTEFKRMLKRLLDGGELAMICYGEPRCGKSTLLNSLVSFLNELKTAVVFNAVLSGANDRSTTWPRLAREFTESRGGRSPFSNFSEAEALLKRAQVDAQLLGVRRILFFIDDAQELSVDQLLGLRKLMQELINCGLSPFVLLFAQPEVLAIPGQLSGNNRASLVDRFFLRKHRLRGLRLTEFQMVLSGYDSATWPVQGGPTYTEHFLPDLWAKGWRMEQQSKYFERAFHMVAKQYARDPDDIPLKYLTFAASSLLLNPGDTRRLTVDLQGLIEAQVYVSGIIESYEVIGDLEEHVLSGIGEKQRTRKNRR